MNRRDFLLFRTEHRSRVVELSCERLYMHYLDAQFMLEQRGERSEATDLYASAGEPQAVFDQRTTEQLFAEVGHRLRDSDVVRVVDAGWLACDDFRERVELLLAQVRTRGGRVELSTASGTQPVDLV